MSAESHAVPLQQGLAARLVRGLGQALLYGLFAATIGLLSGWPALRQLADDEALLRLSFTHPGRLIADCRARSTEEMAKMPANMRQVQDCPRERSAVRVQLELDGTMLVDEAFAPGGLRRDGAAAAYRRMAIGAGRHSLRVRLNDDVRVADFMYERDQDIDVRPGQVVLVDFAADQGGILIK